MNGCRFISICVFILICVAEGLFAAEAVELHIKQYILPKSISIGQEDMFSSANPVGSGRVSGFLSEIEQDQLHTVFGETAAVVPVWQFRSLLRKSEPAAGERGRDKAIVLVGTASIYIPASIQDTVRRSLLKETLEILKKRPAFHDRRIELSILRIPGLLDGTEIVNVEIIHIDERSGRIRLMCRGQTGNTEVQTVVEGRTEILKAYPVADREIHKGDVFYLNDTVLRAEREDSIPESLEINRLGAYIAVRTIKEGEILTAWNTKQKNMVDTGDEVVVVFRSGNVQIKMPGVARGGGTRGGIIPVRLNSGTVKDCRIQYEGEVTIEN